MGGARKIEREREREVKGEIREKNEGEKTCFLVLHGQ